MRLFLLGVLMTGFVSAALLFLKFYRSTRERLFGWFAASFTLLALNQVGFALVEDRGEPLAVYTLRTFAFLLIIVAIIDKNRRSASTPD